MVKKANIKKHGKKAGGDVTDAGMKMVSGE